MESIKAMIPLSVKREIKHVWNYITKKDYRIAWENNRELRQYRTSYGDRNPDKIFYVIRRTSSEAMGSVFKNCIGELEYAIKKEYIPVIDYKNYYDYFLQNEEKQGLENAWEYYFKQVSEYSLEEVYESKNVILSNALDSKHWIYRKQGLKIYSDRKYRSKLAYIMKKHCILSDVMKGNIDKEYARIKSIIGNNKILGVCVLFREADNYVNGTLESSFKGRSIQPTYDQIVADIHKCMKEYNCNYVFISDDSKKYHDKLQTEFGDAVIFSNRIHVDSDSMTAEAFVDEFLNKIDSQVYTMGYLTDMFLLAKCDSVLVSECSTSQLAFLINNGKFENEKVYHLGIEKA